MKDTTITRAIKNAPLPIPETGGVDTKTAAQTKAAPRFLGERPSRTYELQFPLEYEGTEYHAVSFQRPNGEKFNMISELVSQGANQTTVLISVVTGIPVEVVSALDAEDYAAVAEIAPDFIPARFKTAGTPASPSGTDTQE